MDGVQLSQGYRATMSSLFTFRSPGVSGTHFINLERMNAESTLEPLTGFEPRTP